MAVGQTLRFHPAILDQVTRGIWVEFGLTVEDNCPTRRDSPQWRRMSPVSPCWDRPYAPSPGSGPQR